MPEKVKYNKPALSYQQQLIKLKERGLTIENEDKALHLLENISYYRLSAYWHPMLKEPKSEHLFKPDSSFDQAFMLYKFDRELRILISPEIEKIEIAFRAKLINVLSMTNDKFWYTNSTLFKHPGKHASTLSKINEEYNRSDEEFIKEFKNKYLDPMPPSWMMLELCSFGGLSNLYKNLSDIKSKREIAEYFGLDDTTFESWIHSLLYVRNVCAHHSRFWNRRLSIQPQIPRNPKKEWIDTNRTNEYQRINKKGYFVLIMIVYLLNTINSKHSFIGKIKDLFIKYPNVDLKAMGFLDSWEDDPFWIRELI